MSIENLIENVDQQIIKIRTRSLDVSFNELFDMFTNGELIIAPDYQRLFRWEEEKQSRFIESLILEMPVPPIFVIETEDGIYELIDGLQRISSYLHFRGEKLNTENDKPLVLCGCDIIPELDGSSFDTLPKALQIKLKRSFVRMEVIKKESESSLKYHMFKRLNTGGESLTSQEIRNCTIRLLGDKAITFIKKCSENVNFRNTISRLDDDKVAQLQDQELVLKFFAFKNDLKEYKYPVTDYLTSFLEKITKSELDFDYEKEQEIFSKTFKIINDIYEDEAFSNITKNGTIKNNFANYYYDAISLAVAAKLDVITEKSYEKLRKEIDAVKISEDLLSYRTGSETSIKKRIQLFIDGVNKAIEC